LLVWYCGRIKISKKTSLLCAILLFGANSGAHHHHHTSGMNTRRLKIEYYLVMVASVDWQARKTCA